jgi:hypothetical protein
MPLNWSLTSLVAPHLQGSLDNINLFSIITILSFFLLAPFALLKDGFLVTPTALRSLGIVNTDLVMKQALIAGVCFHAYQQVNSLQSKTLNREKTWWGLEETIDMFLLKGWGGRGGHPPAASKGRES